MQDQYHKKTVKQIPLMLAGLILSAVILTGCTAQPAPASQQTPGVTNGAIIRSPDAFEGKELVLSGKIATECGSGCWFLLDDGTGTLYVDLAKNNFAIPQMTGATVVVKGVIRVENGDPKLMATNVTAGSKSWP